MNVRKITRALVAASMAIVLAGCGDDPASPVVRPPGVPRNLKATILGTTSARIEWSAPSDSASLDGYSLRWIGSAGTDSGGVELDGRARGHTATGLLAGERYTINLTSRRAGRSSDVATTDVDLPETGGPPPAAPTRFTASAAGDGRIALRWEAPADQGVTGYLVSWTNAVTHDSSSVTYGAVTGATISNLANGREYRFYLRSMSGTLLSDSVTTIGATAPIYTLDVATGQPLRLYEPSSNVGETGLLVDPARGGPRAVSLATAAPNVQFAWYLQEKDGTPGSVDRIRVGIGRGFFEYVKQQLFDPDVYISDVLFTGASLGEVLADGTLDQMVLTDVNLRVFEIPAAQPGGKGFGFAYRIGPAGDHHYGRVLVKNIGGSLVQGKAPNRYIELELTYQGAAGLPYGRVAPPADVPQVDSPSGWRRAGAPARGSRGER